MPETTNEALWDTVWSRRRGILATVNPNGMPHLTNVHYLPGDEERTILLTTTADRVKSRNLRRDPRAALHVQHEDWFAYSVAEGRVSVAAAEAPGDAATDDLYVIFSAFRGPQQRPAFDAQMIRAKRIIARLHVEGIYGLVHQDAGGGTG